MTQRPVVTLCVLAICVVSAIALGQVSTPRKVNDVNPVYPRESLQAGDEGTVHIQLGVTTSGSVGEALILWTSCSRLDNAALTAVRQWRYEPLRVNGTPVPFKMKVDVPFRLPPAFKSRAGRPNACRWAQLETIPQTLARVGESLTSSPSIPSGIVDMDDVLSETELIVRGRIGSPRKAYLSPDQRDIYTDYPLIKPTVLYDSTAQSSRTPGPGADMAVTVLGGAIQRGGLRYTLMPEALPELPVGADGLFLLQLIDFKYQPVARFLGAFEISDDRLVRPFTRKNRFADEYRGASASATARNWVAAVAKLRQERK
jgi:TonB family protein